MIHIELVKFEEQVETLLAQVEKLRTENRFLRESQESLMGERARLIDKTEQARGRVEAIIGRLKSMENDA